MKYSHPIFDCHVHFGQFRESYYSEKMLVELMKAIGIEKYFIMPISTTGLIDFNMNWESAKRIIKLSEGKAIPALLISIEMIQNSKDLSAYDKMPFKYLKIHGFGMDWHKYPKLLQNVFNCAKVRNLPIMFHTGGRKECEPLQYLRICQLNSEVKVILAHGRPIDQTIKVMKQCSNVWTDTAFMPTNDLVQLVEKGFEDRILFGTDYPIIEAYKPGTDLVAYYNDSLKEISQAISPVAFKKITYLNFYELL